MTTGRSKSWLPTHLSRRNNEDYEIRCTFSAATAYTKQLIYILEGKSVEADPELSAQQQR
jgi:hypothetical protein